MTYITKTKYKYK